MNCAPSEDSDQPGHLPSLIRIFAVCMKKPWALGYPFSTSEDSDQTGWMPMLIRVFAERVVHFVGFVMRWLILFLVPENKVHQWFNLKKYALHVFLLIWLLQNHFWFATISSVVTFIWTVYGIMEWVAINKWLQCWNPKSSTHFLMVISTHKGNWCCMVKYHCYAQNCLLNSLIACSILSLPTIC